MAKPLSSEIRYLTDEQGERIGVVLDMDVFQRLSKRTTLDPELLVNMDRAELDALAHSKLAPDAQERLDKLLTRNKEGKLSTQEATELDRLLEQVDQLTILKARALYTLHRQ